jgi:hypothetical protein
MDGSLPISDVESLVAERAKQLDGAVTLDRVHVFEDPHSTDQGTLIVQVAAKRPVDRKDWTKMRLRFSQAVRDLLVDLVEYATSQLAGASAEERRNFLAYLMLAVRV